MAWNRLVPYNAKGDMLSWASAWDMQHPGFHEKKAKEFTAKLTFEGFYHGRSARGAIFLDEAGIKYPIFLSDLSDMMPHLNGGVIKDIFIPVKRGSNFGLARSASLKVKS